MVAGAGLEPLTNALVDEERPPFLAGVLMVAGAGFEPTTFGL
jgi:hypothetical protein